MCRNSGFKTWLEYYKLAKYPSILKLINSDEIIKPDRITSTGRVYHRKGFLNIWWYKPIKKL